MKTLVVTIASMLMALLTDAQVNIASWEKEKGGQYTFESAHEIEERAVWKLEGEKGLACYMFSLIDGKQEAKMYWDIEEWIEKKKKVWHVRAINLYDQQYLLRIDFKRKSIMIHNYPNYSSLRMSVMKGDVDLRELKSGK